MKPWSHLANAHHIDWVLESLGTDLKKWDAAWNAAWNATLSASRNVTLSATLSAARDAAWNAAENAAWDVTLSAVWNAALRAARGVILALISYDDCDEYLNMSYEQLLIYAMLSERPQAVLLLPLKWIQEHEALVASR